MSKLPSSQKERYQFPQSAPNGNTRFVKIIHATIIDNQQLDLPKGFVKKHGNELSDVVTLEVPSGNSWNIDLRKADGMVFFSGNEWKDFIDHHSIGAGHVLFFTYSPKSRFDVIICDMNSTEICYPPKVENTISSRKQTAEAGEPSEVKTPSWSTKTFARLYSFKSEYRFIIIRLARSYVHQGFLHLPAFFRSYLPKESKQAKIVDSTGTTWNVIYIAQGSNSRIGEGWDAVVKGCGLKEDSVLALELINDGDIILKMTVLEQ